MEKLAVTDGKTKEIKVNCCNYCKMLLVMIYA